MNKVENIKNLISSSKYYFSLEVDNNSNSTEYRVHIYSNTNVKEDKEIKIYPILD